MTTPDITIFVRHSAGCKYEGDERAKRCDCRKWLRWTQNGVRTRRPADTRAWAEAEAVKRVVEDELAGKTPVAVSRVPNVAEAGEVFIRDKRVQGVGESTIQKYERLLKSLGAFCDERDVPTVAGISRELLTDFCATWEERYPSSLTRSKLREKLRSFLRYCYEAEWLARVPIVPKFKVDEPETQPLTDAEYAALLAAVRRAVGKGDPRRRTERNNGRRSPDKEESQVLVVRAFLQCMRWSGLAIIDAVTLPREALTYDKRKSLHRIVTGRTKTGTPVSVAIQPEVAAELLEAHKLNSNPKYLFWSGVGKPQSATSNWGQRYVAPVFKEAGIISDGNMVSHRLRDTFAVDLLSKGVPMEELSRLLGHTSIRTTEKSYAKWSPSRQDRADEMVTATWKKRAA